MGFLFNRNSYNSDGKRLTGFPRYTDVLGRNIKNFLLANLLTFVGFLPFMIGILLSILSSSVLVLIPAGIIGGIFAGPALTCMYDTVLRALRDAPGRFWSNYKRALKQNLKSSILPGIIFCLMFGVYIFMVMLFWWSVSFPGWGTIILFALSFFLFIMFFSLYWPQIALFDQSVKLTAKNCIFFMIRFFPRTAGITLLQIGFCAILVLFLPWSGFLIPFIGFWFIIYCSTFIMYNTLNDTFKIEERIASAFPDQVPFYEDDDEWLARKKEENNASNNSPS